MSAYRSQRPTIQALGTNESGSLERNRLGWWRGELSAEGLLTLSGLLDRLKGLNLLHGLLYGLMYRLNRLSRLNSLG